MNPYDFVRLDPHQQVERRQPAPHNCFTDGFSGHFEGIITTLTPLFIPQARELSGERPPSLSSPPKEFIRNKQGRGPHIIPGSSLKGLFRSVVETVAPGCWLLFDGDYKDYANYSRKLPRQYKKCVNNLCPSCRLFGTINDNSLLLGKVGIEDAICSQPTEHGAIYTPVLSTPKPRHRSWYLTEDAKGNEYVTGRKYFFHSRQIQTTSGLKITHSGSVQNQHIWPINTNSTFTFSGHFTNVDPDEWAALLYAIVLERTDWGHDHDVRHKIGYAKPAGLGSVDIKLTQLTLIDYRQRYTSPNKGVTVYEGDALKDYVNHWITPYLTNTILTFQDLRRIWGWPPANIDYCYPSQAWFEENPHKPISQTSCDEKNPL